MKFTYTSDVQKLIQFVKDQGCDILTDAISRLEEAIAEGLVDYSIRDSYTLTPISEDEELITYNHQEHPNGVKFRQYRKDKLPEWAVNVQPCPLGFEE